MKALVLASLLLIQMAQLGRSEGESLSLDDNTVELSKRQYDCQYMWMMMNSNSGPHLTASLLLVLAAGAILFTSDTLGTV